MQHDSVDGEAQPSVAVWETFRGKWSDTPATRGGRGGSGQGPGLVTQFVVHTQAPQWILRPWLLLGISDWVLPSAVDVASDVDDMAPAAIKVVFAVVKLFPVAPTGDATSGCNIYPFRGGGTRILVAI